MEKVNILKPISIIASLLLNTHLFSFDFSTETITGSGTKDSFIIRDPATNYALKFVTTDMSSDPYAVFQSLNDVDVGLTTPYSGNYLLISNLVATGATITVTADMNNDGIFGDAFKIDSFISSDPSYYGGNYQVKPNGVVANQQTLTLDSLPENTTTFTPTAPSNFDGITSLEIQFSSSASGIIIDNVVIALPTAGDTTPPTFDTAPATSSVTSTTLNLNSSLDENGTVYYVAVANGDTAPTSAQVKAGVNYTGGTVVAHGSGMTTGAGFDSHLSVSGLTANTAYDIYVVGQDDEGTPNVMATATKVDVTTTGLSATFDFESNMTGVGTKTVTQTVSGVTLSITSTTISIVDSSTTSGQDIQGTTTLSTDYGTALETQLDFSVTGYTFNLDSLIIFNVNTSDTFTLTANGQTASLLITAGTTPTWNISSSADASKFQNISSFTLTATDPFAIDFDSISLTNITSGSALDTTPPNIRHRSSNK
ncbi:MAG: hypothetical protein PHF17_11840 [Arcobacteraceae bacterium]|nr:hypothetical protein [Arcobacteraceae bacterium]